MFWRPLHGDLRRQLDMIALGALLAIRGSRSFQLGGYFPDGLRRPGHYPPLSSVSNWVQLNRTVPRLLLDRIQGGVKHIVLGKSLNLRHSVAAPPQHGAAQGGRKKQRSAKA